MVRAGPAEKIGTSGDVVGSAVRGYTGNAPANFIGPPGLPRHDPRRRIRRLRRLHGSRRSSKTGARNTFILEPAARGTLVCVTYRPRTNA